SLAIVRSAKHAGGCPGHRFGTRSRRVRRGRCRGVGAAGLRGGGGGRGGGRGARTPPRRDAARMAGRPHRGRPPRAAHPPRPPSPGPTAARQGSLWKASPYSEEAPAIVSPSELDGALEHLQYAVFRRYRNTLTRAERTRLDNSIDNAQFKIDRYLDRVDEDER